MRAAAKIGNNLIGRRGQGSTSSGSVRRLRTSDYRAYFDRLLPKQLKPFVIDRNDWASRILVEIAPCCSRPATTTCACSTNR